MKNKKWIIRGPMLLVVLWAAIFVIFATYDADKDNHLSNAIPYGTDCDDTNPEIYPGAQEVLGDGIDQDCDASTDTSLAPEYQDMDGDGWTEVQGDCDDDNDSVNPDAEEIPFDSIDNDCDEEVDESIRTVKLQENVVTPSSPWQLGDIKAVKLSSSAPIKKGLLRIIASAEDNENSFVGLGMYIFIPSLSYEKQGFVSSHWHKCPTRLSPTHSDGLIRGNEKLDIEIPLDRVELAIKDCETRRETIDLLSKLNQAFESGNSVTIGFYTSSSGKGLVELAELKFDGNNIDVTHY